MEELRVGKITVSVGAVGGDVSVFFTDSVKDFDFTQFLDDGVYVVASNVYAGGQSGFCAVTVHCSRVVCVSTQGSDNGFCELNVLNLKNGRLGLVIGNDVAYGKVFNKIAPYCNAVLCLADKLADVDCAIAGYLALKRDLPIVIVGRDGVYTGYKT